MVVTPKIDAQVRLLNAADSSRFREVRLEALKQHPDAFQSSFEGESQKPLTWFEDRIAQSDIFGAFVKDELLGTAGHRVQEGLKQRHKGLLWGMYVRAAVRSSGIGKRLVEAVLNHASTHVELVQLAVVSENHGARGLYASLGFVEYGLEKRAIKHAGRYLDEILMVKFLAPLESLN